MANIYGPMAYRPNPGITLNTVPQFQAPAAPIAAPAGPMSYKDWALQNPMRLGPLRAMGHDNSSTNNRNRELQKRRDAYSQHQDQYMMEMLGNPRSRMGGRIGSTFGGTSSAPGLTLDSVAQAYARFLNGGQ